MVAAHLSLHGQLCYRLYQLSETFEVSSICDDGIFDFVVIYFVLYVKIPNVSSSGKLFEVDIVLFVFTSEPSSPFLNPPTNLCSSPFRREGSSSVGIGQFQESNKFHERKKDLQDNSPGISRFSGLDFENEFSSNDESLLRPHKRVSLPSTILWVMYWSNYLTSNHQHMNTVASLAERPSNIPYSS